jgi:ParB family chromosome partitioning protein
MATAAQLLELDIDTVHANPLNPRTDLGDLTRLAASITSVGLIEPIVVTEIPNGQGYMLRAGERRLAASRLAGALTIQAIVVDDSGDLDTVLVALVENIHRDALSPIDQAAGYQAALDLGDLTAATLSRRTGEPVATIERHLKVLGASDSSKAALRDRALTLDEALALMDIEDCPDLYAKAAAAAGTANFAFEVGRALKQAVIRRAGADLEAACGASNVRFLRARDIDYTVTTVDSLTPAAQLGHDTLDCHALALGGNLAPLAYCTNPRRHDPAGLAAADKAASTEERDAAEGERQRILEANAACEVANDVRRAWIAQLLTRPRPDQRATLLYVAAIFATHTLDAAESRQAVRAIGTRSDTAPTAPLTPALVAKATHSPDSAARFLLTAATATAEKRITHEFWLHAGTAFATHLRGLQDLGYEPCEPEIRFLEAQ